MASISIFFDKRRIGKKGTALIKIAVNHKSTSLYISTGIAIAPEHWDDAAKQVVSHPRRLALNNIIRQRLTNAENALIELQRERVLGLMSAKEIKDYIEKELYPDRAKKPEPQGTFLPKFISVAESKSEHTKGVYMQTLRRLRAYLGDDLESLMFEDVTKEWLSSFENFLARTASKNARNIHLRNIRTVFNEAIDDEVTTFYPFRKFKIRPVETAKRSLSIEELRTLFAFEPEPHAVQYLDMFKLIFYLCGINTVDLANLKDIKKGRVEYYRAKTHKLYSIKVEPEAAEIIEKYKGSGDYLLNILDHCEDYHSYAKRMNKELQRLGKITRKGRGGKKYFEPLFPELTTYWARHTWATIAAELDIPKETIAAALGHGGNTVTDIYIRFDQRKVDDANRRVIDYVLNNESLQ